MRIVIQIAAKGDYSYDKKYHSKLQGWVYNLMKGTEYKNLHDSRNPKLFCFSNVFPAKDMKQGDKRNLIISSPMKRFIEKLEEKLRNEVKEISIGEMSFEIESVMKIEPKIMKNCVLISGTPIVIRIPKERYKEYDIESEYNYVYWKLDTSFEPFIKQLEENLLKKFIMFYQLSKEDEKMLQEKTMPLFQEFEHKKSVVTHLVIDGKEQKIFGNLWRFKFNNLNEKQREILQFGLDAGLGERNSYGFGFINLERQE